MVEMGYKITLITPEIVLFAGAVVTAVLGLSRTRALREAVPWTSIVFLIASVVCTLLIHHEDGDTDKSAMILANLGVYVKTLVGVAGIGLV